MINAIFFDFDGVITTDKKGSTSTANYIAAKTSVDKALFLEHYRTFGPDILTGKRTHAEIWSELCEGIGEEIDYQLLIDSFIATPIKEEMIALINNLKREHYVIGLITDNKTDRMEQLISHHQWENLFDILAISANVGSRKNTSAIFDYALDQAQLKPETCLFIDNTAKNLIIPQKMGFKTLFYDDTKQDVPQLITELSALGVRS